MRKSELASPSEMHKDFRARLLSQPHMITIREQIQQAIISQYSPNNRQIQLPCGRELSKEEAASFWAYFSDASWSITYPDAGGAASPASRLRPTGRRQLKFEPRFEVLLYKPTAATKV